MPAAPPTPAVDDEEDQRTATVGGDPKRVISGEQVDNAVESDGQRARGIAPRTINQPQSAPQEQPAAPPTGTTGGLLPQFESDKPRPAIQWSQDPAARQQQINEEITRRRQDNFQKQNPFLPDSWAPKDEPGSRPGDRRFAAQAEDQFQYQQHTARAAAVAERRQQIEQRKTANDALQAQYRGSGQQFYTDSSGEVKPVIEAETNRPLYHPTKWESGVDPKTGQPSMTMRDKYGQRQFKAPQVVAPLDPTDGQMYYKMPDGTVQPAGSIDDFAKHPNYNIAKAALAAKTRNVHATHEAALAGPKEMANEAMVSLQNAKSQRDDLNATIIQNQSLLDETDDPAKKEGLQSAIDQMKKSRDDLNARVTGKGDLANIAASHRAAYISARAQQAVDTYRAQAEEIAAAVKAKGGKLDADPAYKANLQQIQLNQRAHDQAEAEFQRVSGAAIANQSAGQPAQPPTNPTDEALQQSEPSVAARAGVKAVGGVGMDEFARRYGDGSGAVDPASMLRLDKRSKAIADTLSNSDSTMNPVLTKKMEDEKAYIDALFKQRFARLDPDQRARVAEATGDPSILDKFKGVAKSGAETAAAGGGNVLKGVELAAHYAPPMADEFGNFAPGAVEEYNQRINQSPSQTMADVQSGPAYKLGNFIQEAAQETYKKNPKEQEGMVSQALNAAAEGAGGFVPLVASGPLAPVTAGLETAGGEMESIYRDRVAKGATPDAAANFAVKRAMISGGIQAALFELLPKPLQATANKVIVDNIAGSALKKFLANRIAQGAEGAVLGGTSTAAGNLAAGRPVGDGVAASAAGLGAAQMLLPRAGPPQRGESIPPVESKPVEPEAPPPTPEQQAADAEFQRKLNEGDQKPSTAKEAASVFEPALAEKANIPPPSKSAADSAQVFAKDATDTRTAATAEQGVQALVDELQQASGKPRDEILATRKGKDPAQWAEELQNEIEYHQNPLTVDPERRANELRADLKRSDEEWAQHLNKTAAEAETHANIQGDKNAAAERFKQDSEAARARHESLMQRRDAIEQQLAEAERIRQSNKGGADLKNDLAAKSEAPAATDVVSHVSALGPDEFSTWAREQPGGFTQTAHQAGIDAIGRPEAIDAMKAAKVSAEKEFASAMADAKAAKGQSSDAAKNSLIASGSKVQFFSEAIDAAENTGGAAGAPDVAAAHTKSSSQEAQPTTEEPSNAPKIESSSEATLRQTPENRQGVRSENAVDQGAATARQSDAAGGIASGGGVREPSLRENGAGPRDGAKGENAGQAGKEAVSEARVTSGLTAMDERRAVIAERRAKMTEPKASVVSKPESSEKTPPAMMKPADRIAELTANGVKTVNGKPLTGEGSANAAELINAVGKLRRGQLTEETAPAPSTEATKRLSDRAIDTLQKALERNKQEREGGFVGSEFGLTYNLAEKSAIELAILGVRAGRAISDVVKLAVAHFKARFPAYGPEHIYRIESAIREAIDPKEPAPTEKAATAAKPTAKSSDAPTTGIAHRVSEARGAEAERGDGISPKESVERGRELIAKGFDPQKAISDFNATKAISADAMAAVRAHGEELSKLANKAADEHGTDSPQYKAAWDADKAWIEKVKPMQTEWHKIGQAQQGETEIDTGTFHGLQKAFFESSGKDFTPKQAVDAKRIAGDVKGATDAAETAKDKLLKTVDDGKKPTSKSIGDSEKIITTRKPGKPWTPEEAKALWHVAKAKYLDQGVNDINDIRAGLATDYGLTKEDIYNGLAAPKGARAMTDEMYAKMAERRRVVNQAKQWVAEAKYPGYEKFFRSVPNASFNLATFGHGTVWTISHAGNQYFLPKATGPLFRELGRSFKLMGVTDGGAYHERMMQDLVRDENFVKAKRAGLANDPFRYQDDYQNAGVVKLFKQIGLMGNRGFDGMKLFRQFRFNQEWSALPESLRTPDGAKLLADNINKATGITKSSKLPAWMNTVFFAPKLEMSRWAFLYGDPIKDAKTLLNQKNSSPEQIHAAYRDLRQKATMAGVYMGALAVNQALLSATGSNQKINFTNPKSGDWLSFKGFGHNVGVVGPMINSVRFLQNIAHDFWGERSKLEQIQGTRGSEAAGRAFEYARGKLSPFGSVALDVASQSDAVGRPMPWSKDPLSYRAKQLGEKSAFGYGEYASKKLLPIPMEEAAQEIWRSQGATEDQISKWMRAISIGISAGSTGARITPEAPAYIPRRKPKS